MAHSAADADVPAVYSPDEAAAILKCKASWLKEKARKRKIPFTMIGGAYRWTAAHLDEIIRLGEHQPEPGSPARAPGPRAPETPADAGPVLRARPPRRRRVPG